MPGLYISGADAGAAGMGTHQAATSAMRVADMAVDYIGTLESGSERRLVSA